MCPRSAVAKAGKSASPNARTQFLRAIRPARPPASPNLSYDAWACPLRLLERGLADRPGTDKELAMNWDRIEGNWKQAKGKIKEQWGKLTDDDLDIIDGKREQLAGRIQHAYGVSKDEAEKQLARFESRYEE
jgi:uncharacterized protein YjbJ (UPF0337 family)